jgi:hypothetical protein
LPAAPGPITLSLMRIRYLTALLVASLLVACSCGSSTAPPPEDTTQARPETPEETKRRLALERLKVRQEAACEQVSPVVTECAIADARATMKPEEFAKLDVERLRPVHLARYQDECTASDMSPRQVKIFEECMADTTCEVFLACLDKARPQN